MAIRVLQNKNKTSYQASVRIQGRRLTQCFDRKTDADRWLRLQLEKRDNGELRIRTLPTLSEFVDVWLPLREAQVSPATQALHSHLLKNWILPKAGAFRLNEVTGSTIQQLMRDLIASGNSPRMANMVMALVGKIFNDAANDFNFRVGNPAAKLERLKEKPRKLEFWDAEEIRTFLATVEAQQPAHAPLLKFLLNTGCRIGEAYALQWGDVELNKGYVVIRRTVDRINHRVQETTKGNKLRYVGLNPLLLKVLKELKLANGSSGSEVLVFPNKAGSLHHHSSFQRRCFDKCIKESGVRKIRIHDMRHTFAAHFVMNGGSIYDLKQILGHSEIKMTERYAHLAPDYLRGRTSLVSFG